MLIENLVSNELKLKLQEIICSPIFDWNWYEASSDPSKDSIFQLGHLVYLKDYSSQYYNDISKVLGYFEQRTGIKIKNLLRAKVNMLTYRGEVNDRSTIHQDYFSGNPNHISMVYYVNDSDGDTLIYDMNDEVYERASPKAGNAVWFKSELYHHATVPRLHSNRIVINFVFEIEEEQNVSGRND